MTENQSKHLHNEQSEQKILGLILFDNALMSKVAGLLESTDFYFADNKILYTAIGNSFNKHGSADTPFLVEELALLSNKSKEEWMNYFAKLIAEKGLEPNIERYVELIKEKKQARDLKETLATSVDLVNSGQDSVTSLIGKVESKIQDITRQRDLKDFEGIDSLTNEFIVKMKEIEEGGVPTGLKTGIGPLDSAIGGFQAGQFIIVAARPSMGKTAFALEIAKNVAKSGNRVGFFSLEMPSDQLILRMISSESMINSRELYNPHFPINQSKRTRLTDAEDIVRKMSMRIDDSASLKMSELAWKARKAKEQGGLDLIVIDYLQLIDTDDSNPSTSRQQIISDISRQLKSLARELEIPIISLSQLSRKVESREDKRPMLSDIRESGAIEQDADIIMFLYRKEYYAKEEEKSEQSHSSLDVIIGKNRNGQVGTVRLGIDLEHSRIVTITNS